jgi:hypothetical protein
MTAVASSAAAGSSVRLDAQDPALGRQIYKADKEHAVMYVAARRTAFIFLSVFQKTILSV